MLAALRPGLLSTLFAGLVLATVCPAGAAQAVAPLRYVRIFDDGQAHGTLPTTQDPFLLHRVWPFCPTDRIPCSVERLAWVEVGISFDAYSERRNDAHDSIVRILKTTETDLEPLTAALSQYFDRQGVRSDVQKVGFVQGLIEGIHYGDDADTGWTDYPKFGLEFLGDQLGDCDDAAIAAGALLDGLGYDGWFVLWRARNPAEPGHLSTAVTPDHGDLASFKPPPDSQWIAGPAGERLLHVDATGSSSGCGRAWTDCGGVGFNEWYKKDLTIATVTRVTDPDLEAKIPLHAWDNDGHVQKHADRRASEEAIRDEVLTRYDQNQRLRDRLRRLGLEPRQAERYLHPRWYQVPILLGSYVALCGGLAGVLGWTAWRRRVARLERAAAKSVERSAKRF